MRLNAKEALSNALTATYTADKELDFIYNWINMTSKKAVDNRSYLHQVSVLVDIKEVCNHLISNGFKLHIKNDNFILITW